MKSLINKKAKGFSKCAGKYVEGVIYYHLANGVDILTKDGLAFVEHGEYELIKEASKSQNKPSQAQQFDYEETSSENAVATALAIIAWVIYIGGGFAGLILLEDILVSIICWVSCFVAGTIFLGFSEIIKLLNDIKHKE